MARIGITLSGIERSLLNRLAEANAGAALSTLRMAEKKKILGPADSPSTFMALSGLQGQLSLVSSTMANVTAASSMITQAQTTAGQIRTKVEAIRTELEAEFEGGGLTPEEREAAQLRIDALLQDVNRLADTTINGRRVLDGSADYTTSGRNPSQVAAVRVHSAGSGGDRIGRDGADLAPLTLSGEVVTAATRGELVYTGTGGNVKAGDTGTVTVTGKLGSADIDVAAGEDLDAVALKINNNSHLTGIVASVGGTGDNELTFSTVHYGEAATLAVSSTGTFDVTGGAGDGTAQGTDATVVVNGRTYGGSDDDHVDGNRVTYVDSNGLHVEIELTPGYAGDFSPITITGGAMIFQLSTSPDHTSSVAVPGLKTADLGAISGRLAELYSGGSAAGLGDNASRAIRIVDEALGDIGRAEGTLDGFYNASISSASSLLSDLETELESAITQTDGYDESEETQRLARYEGLAQNAISGLAILNQQRSAIIDMIKQIAGLA